MLAFLLLPLIRLGNGAPMNLNVEDESAHGRLIRKLEEYNKHLGMFETKAISSDSPIQGIADFKTPSENVVTKMGGSISPETVCSSSSKSNSRPQTAVGWDCSRWDKMLLKAENENRFDDALTAIREHGANINYQDSAGVSPLLFAIIKRNYNFAEELLKSGADPNLPDFNGRSPLHYAAIILNADLVKLLLHQSSIDVNSVDTKHMTPLAMAIQKNNFSSAFETIQALLNTKKIDFSYLGPDGETYLMLASAYRSYNTAKMILSAASPDILPFLFSARIKLISQSTTFSDFTANETDNDTLYSPLHIAALNNRKDIILLLLCNGAEPGIVRDYTRGGKHKISPEIIQLIIKPKLTEDDCRGHRIRKHDEDSDNFGIMEANSFAPTSPASVCYSQSMDDPLRNWKCSDGDKMLLKAEKENRVDDALTAIREHGANVNIQDSGGVTPLIFAIVKDHYKFAEELLERGADPNLPSFSGYSPLLFATNLKRVNFVKLLVQQPSIDVNQVSSNGSTPLAFAMKGNLRGAYSEIIKTLIDSGKIDFSYTDIHNETYFMLATLSIMYDYETAKMILSAAPSNLLQFLFTAKVKMIPNPLGDLPSIQTDEMYSLYSPLHIAAIRDRKDLMLLMLCNGAKPGIVQDYTRGGKHKISPEIIKLIIKPKLTEDDCRGHLISQSS